MGLEDCTVEIATGEDGATVVRISGDLDVVTMASLAEALKRAYEEADTVVIMERVRFLISGAEAKRSSDREGVLQPRIASRDTTAPRLRAVPFDEGA